MTRVRGVDSGRLRLGQAGDHRRHGLRLAAAFGTTAEFWMNLQKRWELEVARDAFEGKVERVG